MQRPLTAVLCGVGGYGGYYLETLLDRPESPVRFAGFADPAPERSVHFERLRASGLPICRTLEEFYDRGEAELAILASPIQFHCPQTICALEHGSHVLCEKPLCATAAEARSMLAAQRRAGRVVAVGYQGSFLESTQRFKADIRAGVWGRPLTMKCLTLWPRSREYYRRNAWAGRIRDGQGRWVLDSPVNNAAAHFLHHMLYLLGDAPARSAVPLEVEAGLYRAHDIENYDTAVLRCTTAGGARIFFAVSLAVARKQGPAFEFGFENGTVRCDSHHGIAEGRLADGSLRSYGGDASRDGRKILDTVGAIAEGREPLCGIEAAMSHTIVVGGAQESGEPVVAIPRELIRETEVQGEHWLRVDGLDDLLTNAYDDARLPSTADAPWVRPARKTALVDRAQTGGQGGTPCSPS